MELRPYQIDTITLTRESAMRKEVPCIVLPTGAGKSIVQAMIVVGAAKYGTNILCATHVQELVEQNYLEFIGIEKGVLAGIYSAGLKRRDLKAQVCFASVQSIEKRIFEHHAYGVLMIDEAHLISPKEGTRYQNLIKKMRTINPSLIIIGMTATPYRMDQGYITHGKNAIFTHLIEAPRSSLPDLIADGFLSDIRSKSGMKTADLAGLPKRGGEFVESEMQKRFEVDELVVTCVADAMHHGHDRKGWLFFAASVKNAREILSELHAHGVRAEIVTGETPKEERKWILSEYKAQRITALVSVGVLTTGFNAKHLDLIVIMRATESIALLVQMIGRGTRLFPAKKNCLVLDYGENIMRHGCIDKPMIYQKDEQEEAGEAPVKECDQCKELVFAGCRICPCCGFEFPEPKPKLTTHAADDALLSTHMQEKEMIVSDVIYNIHAGKAGKPDTLCVTYVDDNELTPLHIKEYVCIEHKGYARTKAREWWKDRTDLEIPDNVESAFLLAHELQKPDVVMWRKDGKYKKITSYEFGE